jgi:hypothetical protein
MMVCKKTVDHDEKTWNWTERGVKKNSLVLKELSKKSILQVYVALDQTVLRLP